jgi:hypothetical protein
VDVEPHVAGQIERAPAGLVATVSLGDGGLEAPAVDAEDGVQPLHDGLPLEVRVIVRRKVFDGLRLERSG